MRGKLACPLGKREATTRTAPLLKVSDLETVLVKSGLSVRLEPCLRLGWVRLACG